MINIWAIIIVLVLGLGIFFVFNEIILKKKAKRTFYFAEIYGLRDGVRKENNIELQDLVLLDTDKLRASEYPDGRTVYELLKTGKTVPAVEVTSVDKLSINGKTVKRVKVLLVKDSCTLLAGSYNKSVGDMVFEPIKYDTMTSVANDIHVKTNRYKNKADIWSKITPIISIVLSIIAVVAIVVINGNTMAKVAQSNAAAAAELGHVVDKSIEDIVLASIISSGFTKEDLNSLKEEIQEIKDLKNNPVKALGNQNVYKVNNTINSTRS